jgi:MoaA/NifB/PqqE/SkfB family radical SAM enzyme
MRIRQAVNMLQILTDPRVVLPALREFRHSDEGESTRGARIGFSWRQRLGAIRFTLRWLWRERLVRHRGQWVIGSYLPPFPGPAYRRFFERTLLDGRLAPCSAFLAVTKHCPADCWHCSLKGRRLGQDLTTSQWLDVIAQLHRLGVCCISMSGGEPSIREDLPTLVRAARDGGAAVEMFTSGIGLTEEKIETLRDAGLWAVGVSLDRTEPQAVNRMRGAANAFDAAIGALENSPRAGLYTFINAVVDREAVASGEYRRLYELGRRLKIHELRLLEPMPCGRLARSFGRLECPPHQNDTACEHAVAHRDYCLTPEQVAELRQFHRTTNRRGHGPKVCAFAEIESPELFGCGAGTFHLHIDPSGNVCPCDFVPLSFGNVLAERLEVILRRMGEAMRQPRRHCFLQTITEQIDRLALEHGYPLSPELSVAVAAESPDEELPDYFQHVATPLGFPAICHNSASARPVSAAQSAFAPTDRAAGRGASSSP